MVTVELKIDSKAKENGVVSYDYDLNKSDLGFGSKSKHPIGAYIKAVEKR